jgi:hypothetical protein
MVGKTKPTILLEILQLTDILCSLDEQPLITQAVTGVAEALEVLLSLSIAEAINQFNL